MTSLDNFHVQNNGTRSTVRVPLVPMDGSASGYRVTQLDLGGKPGQWDKRNRAPLPLSGTVDPFSRVSLGRDVPGQEYKTSYTNPYYLNLDTQATILPGGNAESWVLFQDTRPSWSKLLPFKY